MPKIINKYTIQNITAFIARRSLLAKGTNKQNLESNIYNKKHSYNTKHVRKTLISL